MNIFTPTNAQLLERFLVHVLLIALGAAFMYVEQLIVGHNFGSYQALAVALNSIVFTAVEKFFTNQGITLPTGTTLVSTNSSPAQQELV